MQPLPRRRAHQSPCPRGRSTTEGPSWGHFKVVLGAIRSFLEPFCGHLSPKNDKVSEELTLRYPHEEPCVAKHRVRRDRAAA